MKMKFVMVLLALCAPFAVWGYDEDDIGNDDPESFESSEESDDDDRFFGRGEFSSQDLQEKGFWAAFWITLGMFFHEKHGRDYYPDL